MEVILDPKYKYFWALVLAIALYLSSRALVFGLMLRRAKKLHGELPPEATAALRKRAGLASALLSFAVAFAYTHLATAE